MSSRLRPKISETDRRYCACLWWPRRLTKMPTSWSSAATSRRSRSRLPSPCSPLSSSKRRIARRATWRGGGGAEREGAPALELVEEADREARDLAGVGGVEAVALAEGGGGGEDLAREVLHPAAQIGLRHVEEEPRAQRGLGHEHRLRLGLEEQLAVDDEGGDERFHLRERQPVALGELVVVEGHRLLAEGEEALPLHGPRRAPRLLPHHLIGGEADVSAEGDEVARLPERHLAPDVPDHVLDVAEEETHPLLVAAVPRGEVLSHADGAEDVGPGVDRLPLAQERQGGAAPAPLREEGVGGGHGLVLAQGLPHRPVGGAVLLRA